MSLFSPKLDILAGLNPQQRQAVETTEGALLILAGAGSGKTRVITVRIAYLIAEKRVAPHNILAVTFTNKAAAEMRERINNLLQGRGLQSSPLIATFHSLCVRILRQDIEHLGEGFTKSFTIYDTDDSIKVIKACVKDIGLDEKQLASRQVLSAISSAKNRGEDFEMFASSIQYTDEKRNAIARVFKLYEERLRNSNSLDFDDLMIKTVKLLRKSAEVREKYNNKFKYILVDEYQDTTALQFALIKYLTEKQQNICVVGDESQCLPKGTKILTPDGYKNIEEIAVNDEVLSAFGHSRVGNSKVTRVKPNKYNGKIVKITTQCGIVLEATPNHILFGKVNPFVGKHLVYLMYRQDKGYRIGRSQGHRVSLKDNSNVLGLQVRSNQENADKMWILKVCDSKSEAAYFEELYSTRYGIPTMVFHIRGRGAMSFSQEMIDNLYEEIDTRKRVKKVFQDFYLFQSYPHFQPKARFESNRFMLNLILFGDKRTTMPAPWGGHRIQFGTTEKSIRPKFEEISLPCREGRRHTWRMETARTTFSDAFQTCENILKIDPRITLIRKAALVENEKSFYETPASHFREGMSIAIFEKGKIIEDVVEKVEYSDYIGEVYDLDIENTHNYIAENIVTHNSIYGFRGADIANIMSFEQHYPNAKSILLEQNYRSTQTILDVADAVIENNSQRRKKKLWTDNDSGGKIKYFQALDGDYEARFVAQKIDEHRRYNKEKVAILYRTNAQSRLFEEHLRRARIEYNIVGGFSFYERAEIKDVISYLKLALNPFDDIALNRVINTPTRGLGKTTLDELAFRAKDFGTSIWETIAIITDEKYEQPRNLTPRALEALKKFKSIIEKLSNKVSESATGERPVTDVVVAAIEDTGYAGMLREENSDESAARLENLEELVNAAVDYDKQEANGLRDFIDHAALSSDTDKFDRNAPVTMMTVHSAKGLEFPTVFLVGLEDGIFPHSRSINDPKELEEERRLAYVAITRAEKTLYITHAMRRRTYGEEIAAEPSQFLKEMPLDLLEDLSRGSSWLSFARSSNVQTNRRDAKILRGEAQQFEKPKNLYTGKTYNSTDAIAEFFKQKKGMSNEGQERSDINPTIAKPSAFDNLKAASSNQSQIPTPKSQIEKGFVAGSHVRHPKYGKGLVLRREGSGDNVKLTVSFPGFGQKKLIEKFANLEKA